MSAAALVGAAESDLGETGRTVLELQVQAISRALADAGLDLSEVDGIATNGVGRFSSTSISDVLGLRPRWAESSFLGGSSFESYVARAAHAIDAGQAETVVVAFASNQRSARGRSLGGQVERDLPEAQFETPYAPLFPLSYYAMAAQVYLYRYGRQRSDLARVAVTAREWALRNPAAFTYDDGPLRLADVLESPLISSPLSKADCCLVTDGGGAVIVTSLDRARDLPSVPIRLLGYGEASSNVSMTSRSDILDTGAADSGRRAFERAGLQPADVDVLELYDSFTITTLLSLEALGFAEAGHAGRLFADGRTDPGGDRPVNTSGGGLAYCHPGQFGVLLLVEAVRQLRGVCGARQVPDAQIALAHGTGGILSHHATILLGRDG